MALQIVKATEAIPVEHPVFMLFGQPGICKSTLGYSFERPLLLDFDKGAHRAANRQDTLVIPDWDAVIELTASKAHLEPYATIVVDTVGRALDLMTAHLADGDAKNFPGGNPTLQGWGKLKTMFRQWVAHLRAQGKDVVLIAHDREDKDGDRRIVRPDIAGGSYGEVLKVADFVGYVQLNGKQRVLDFNPTDAWIGKNPAQWPAMPVPPVALCTRLGADLMAKGREALGNISAESAALAAQVALWRTKIEMEGITPGTLLGLVTEAQALQVPALQLQVKRLIMDRSKALGFTYDQAAKVFVDPKAGAGSQAVTQQAHPLDAGTTAQTTVVATTEQVELPPAAEKPARTGRSRRREDLGPSPTSMLPRAEEVHRG